MSKMNLALPVLAASLCAAAALMLVPRGYETGRLIVAQDDPAALADLALTRTFDAPRASREIEAALAAGDAELAQSIVDLAQVRGVPLDPALNERVTAANSASAAAARTAGSFAHGLVSGEPSDAAGLAGTLAGDLFVFGDVRDALREGTRLAAGEEADELILGLACIGLAVTAGTYASLGAGTPARAGLSLMKAARKTGQIGADLATGLGRSLRGVVDTGALAQAFTRASLVQPAGAVRAVRSAVKIEKADDVVRFVGDVGRVQGKAGTRAALDGLKISESPKDMAKVARLAEAKGGQTRAVIKILGRGAIALTVALWDLTLWLFWALLTLFGLVSSLKRAVERATQRHLDRRKRRRAKALAAAPASA
jgi:hypothetical protein